MISIRVPIDVNILNSKKMAQRAIKSPSQVSLTAGEFTVNDLKVKEDKSKHIHVWHKLLYYKNSKMRSLWHCDNEKMDRISQS